MEQKFGKNSILGRAKRPSRADIEVLREFCKRYERLLQRCPGIVEHLDLQDVPERHSQDHQHDPKGYHFRQG